MTPFCQNEGETLQVGAVATEVFSIRICSGEFCLTHNLTALVGPGERATVRPSNRAEVDRQPVHPQKGVLLGVARQVREAVDPASIINAIGEAKRPTKRAQVGNGVSRLGTGRPHAQ